MQVVPLVVSIVDLGVVSDGLGRRAAGVRWKHVVREFCDVIGVFGAVLGAEYDCAFTVIKDFGDDAVSGLAFQVEFDFVFGGEADQVELFEVFLCRTSFAWEACGGAFFVVLLIDAEFAGVSDLARCWWFLTAVEAVASRVRFVLATPVAAVAVRHSWGGWDHVDKLSPAFATLAYLEVGFWFGLWFFARVGSQVGFCRGGFSHTRVGDAIDGEVCEHCLDGVSYFVSGVHDDDRGCFPGFASVEVFVVDCDDVTAALEQVAA